MKHYTSRRVRRGESRSVSSLVEDLFAKYMHEIADKKFNILVVPVLSFKIGGKAFVMKPDLCLTYNRRVTAFYDLKMDLGYKRTKFYQNCNSYEDKIKLIRGKVCSITDGKTKRRTDTLLISKTLKYHVVVISDGNIKKEDFKDIERDFKKLSLSKLYVLTEDCHPNTYKYKTPDEVLDNIKIRKNDFEGINKTCVT